MRRSLLTYCAAVALLPLFLAAAEKELPPQEFLRELRAPLTQEAWGEFTGRLVHVRKGKPKLEGNLWVRLNFTPQAMLAELKLNERNTYILEQQFNRADRRITVDLPDKEAKPGLFDFGVTPADLSFAFIYWDFVEELPRSSSRWRDCRVMKLVSPDKKETAHVWFDAEYKFPMQAEWYRQGETKPWRTLLLQGAKKFDNGIWFVKEMRLDGDGWKTQVKFDFVSKNAIGTGPRK